MQSRILQSAEYAEKLRGTELETVWSIFPPGASVVVVEDGDRVVACWALYQLWHVEGVWIDPAYQRQASVGRRLLAAMYRLASSVGARAVNTGAMSADVAAMLFRLGATELPGRHYALPIDPSRFAHTSTTQDTQ